MNSEETKDREEIRAYMHVRCNDLLSAFKACATRLAAIQEEEAKARAELKALVQQCEALGL